jgi:hypothetical protein
MPVLGITVISPPPARPPSDSNSNTPRTSPRSPRSVEAKRALMKKAAEDAYVRELLQGVSNAGDILDRANDDVPAAAGNSTHIHTFFSSCFFF